jgi:hypothetical protein
LEGRSERCSVNHSELSQRTLNQGLWKACKRDNTAAASYWLAKGAEVNARDVHHSVGLTGGTALHRCAHFANTQTVDLLLILGADPNAVDNEGRTPLFFTSVASVADRLVVGGAYLSRKDDLGESALQSRETNGWHLDEELRAALISEGSATKMVRAANSEIDPVSNLNGEGDAHVWGIHFHVQETRHRRSGSTFNGTVGGNPKRD